MKKMLAATALVSALILTACGRGNEDEGGLTAQDNRELNNAAEMLDTSPDSLVATDNAALGNGEDGAMDAVETGEDEANGSGGNGE